MYGMHRDPPEVVSLRRENETLRSTLNVVLVQIQMLGVLSDQENVRAHLARTIKLIEDTLAA